MTGHDLDPIVGARQAVASGCADIAPIVMWAYLDSTVKEYDALTAKLAAAEQERDHWVDWCSVQACALAAVRELHAPREEWLEAFGDARGPRCSHCHADDWPCPTVRALAAAEQDEPTPEQP